MPRRAQQGIGAGNVQQPLKGKLRGRKSLKAKRVGQKEGDGTLIYPHKVLAEVAAALCQQNTVEGVQGVFDLAVEAICARPEFANLRLYARMRSAHYPDILALINNDKPEMQQEVRSDAIPSATHREAEQMTPELIHARLMWKLRSLLEGNIATRQASTPPIAREKPLSNQLPVPMQSFCESEDTWWKLLREVVNWMSATFIGKLRFSPDSDTAEALAIRAAVRQYRQQHGIVGDRQYGGHASRSDEGRDEQAVEDESQSTAPETPTARRVSEEDVPQCSPS